MDEPDTLTVAWGQTNGQAAAHVAGVLDELYCLDEERFASVSEDYRNWREDRARNALGLPALHARFTGPTPRKHYSRRSRRKRRWL